METVPLWCIIFINCMTLLGSIWILFASIQKQGQMSYTAMGRHINKPLIVSK